MHSIISLKSLNSAMLILSFLLFLTTSQNIDENYTQTVDNNIPVPTHIQIAPQAYHLTGQITIPLIIQPPSMLFPIYKANIQNNDKGNCWVEQLAVNKQFGDYIKFEKNELGKYQSWSVQILDASYCFESSKVFAILTDGRLLQSKLKTTTLEPNQIKDFVFYQYQPGEENNIWQLDEYQLYSTSTHIFLLKQKRLFNVKFIQGKKKWTMTTVDEGNQIQQIIKQKDQIYLVKTSTIHRIVNGSITQDILDKQNPIQQKTQFVDLAFDGRNMYVLDRLHGVYLIDISRGYSIVSKYFVDFHDFANTISAKNGTVLINFKMYRKTFIGQFFFIHQSLPSLPPSLKLNKFYYRFQQMTNILLFQNFGIAYSLSQMNIFQHSINRNSPFGELQTELIYRAGYPKILDIIKLDSEKVSYLLVEKNGIFVESIGADKNQKGLFDIQVKCVFFELGVHQIAVSYSGFCKNNKNPTQSYCTKQNIYSMDVGSQKEHRLTKSYNDHMFMVLILLVILILIIGGVLTYRRVTEDRRINLMALLQRRQQYLNQMTKIKDVQNKQQPSQNFQKEGKYQNFAEQQENNHQEKHTIQ